MIFLVVVYVALVVFLSVISDISPWRSPVFVP